MKTKADLKDPKFYEMDGARQAYSNRATVLALLMGLVALVAVVGFVLIRIVPPTVIRVSKDNEPMVISPYSSARNRFLPSILAAAAPGAAPDEYEKEAFVKTFLVRYLNYDPYTLSHNWADATNQMTDDLRHAALTAMETNDTVGKLEDEQTSSTFKLSHIEESKTEPLTYTAFGVRTIRTMDNDRELINEIVEEYHVRLKDVTRSRDDPSGLLIDEFWSRQIQGGRRDAVLADRTLAARNGSGAAAPADATDGGKP